MGKREKKLSATQLIISHDKGLTEIVKTEIFFQNYSLKLNLSVFKFLSVYLYICLCLYFSIRISCREEVIPLVPFLFMLD